MAKKRAGTRKKQTLTRELLAKLIYWTTRIEEPSVTPQMARRAANKVLKAQ